MNNNNNNNKMNIVTKTFTNLPDEVCNIIYEYYKLPFLDEIQNPFNKYCLVRERSTISILSPKKKNPPLTKKFNYNNYTLHFDLERRSIIPQQLICDRWYPDLKSFTYRNLLKKKCRDNGIEFKDRTPTKTLIKRLMKL